MMIARLGTCCFLVLLALSATAMGQVSGRRSIPSEDLDEPVQENTCRSDCSPWHSRLRLGIEGLYAWSDEMDSPPLVTTSVFGTSPANAGVLHKSTTQILFGGDELPLGSQFGGRATIGYALNQCACDEIEVTYLGLERATGSLFASSADTAILARPYFDAQFGQQAALLVAHPDFLSGTIGVSATSQFQAAEVLWRQNGIYDGSVRLDLLAGYRFAQLDEQLRIAQFSEYTSPQGLVLPGTTKSLLDSFETSNVFHGVELGLAYKERLNGFSVELVGKLGIGGTRSATRIDGTTTTAVPGDGTADFVGGLLAQSTNIGVYERNRFTLMPELGVTATLPITCRSRLTFGYSLIYWFHVNRPGNAVDLRASQLPPETPTGSRTPQFAFGDSDFVLQGLRFGFEYQF